MRRAVIVLTALALLGGCSGDEPAAPASDDQTTTTVPGETTTSDDTTTTVEPEPSALALRGDGLGVVDFGAPPDAAVSAIKAELGDPAQDPGWEDQGSSSYGTCPGERVRGVEWGGLVLLFTDGDTPEGSGEHFFSWHVIGAPPPVATVTGLGWGATAQDAEDLYPEKVERHDEEPFPSFLRIDAEGGQITAFLDDADTITNLEAGTPCGE